MSISRYCTARGEVNMCLDFAAEASRQSSGYSHCGAIAACWESAGSMAVENQTIKDAASEGTALERYVNVHMGNFIHVFLTLLAVLVMVAASIALVQIVHHGFPQLWHVADEYTTL